MMNEQRFGALMDQVVKLIIDAVTGGKQPNDSVTADERLQAVAFGMTLLCAFAEASPLSPEQVVEIMRGQLRAPRSNGGWACDPGEPA